MARDARLVITKALDRLAARYSNADTPLAAKVIEEVRAEIEYAFDLAQIPQTPGRKPKAADGKKD